MNMTARVLAALLLGFFALIRTSATERYEIDPAHAFVTFTIAHFAGKARGSFTEVSGTIIYDETDITKSSVSVIIKTASIYTGNGNRDTHLKSPDFFDVEKYPEATFNSRRIEKRGETYLALGDLTLRGVTKEVTMPFTIAGPIKDPLPTGVKRLIAQASLKIDRRDFEITWSRLTEGGGLFVGNEVILEINVEGIIPKSRTRPSAHAVVQAKTKNVEAELRQLEREWNEAIVKKDFVALELILGDEFVYIDYAGGVNPKAEMLRGLKNSEAVIEPFETEDVVVRVYGDTAVVTGRFTQKVLFKGQSFSGTFRYTDVYVKRGKNWQAVSAHSSRLPDKK